MPMFLQRHLLTLLTANGNNNFVTASNIFLSQFEQLDTSVSTEDSVMNHSLPVKRPIRGNRHCARLKSTNEVRKTKHYAKMGKGKGACGFCMKRDGHRIIGCSLWPSMKMARVPKHAFVQAMQDIHCRRNTDYKFVKIPPNQLILEQVSENICFICVIGFATYFDFELSQQSFQYGVESNSVCVCI